MDCPHCGKAFHDSWDAVQIFYDQQGANQNWFAYTTLCPACKRAVIELQAQFWLQQEWRPSNRLRAFPTSIARKPVAAQVPADIRADYEEACRVLPISAKASAALSRRCVQAILLEKGYTQKDLSKQIGAVLDEKDPTKTLPTGLHMTVDAIRNFGNFSAHAITDQTTLQIITVEPGEAEWCLEILDEMFDHYYVKPAIAKARKKELDEKLKAARKPPAK